MATNTEAQNARGQSIATGNEPELVAPDRLYFDAKNPRLVEYLEDGKATQPRLLKILWDQMAVDELAMSMAASGYFAYEPLFVVEEDNKLVVIEGNRRLAAVKLLLDPNARKQLRATDLPTPTKAALSTLQKIPVLRTTRKEAWPYLGFKHVNGPAKWDSYPKAQYIAEVHNKYGVSLEDLADRIGDRHRTVQRLYRALMVIEQAEKAGQFTRSQKYKGHFSFSHLYTGLDYDGIAKFIHLTDESTESRSPVPMSRLKQLGELCKWLYGDSEQDIAPQVLSQNPHLRQLDEVLKSKDALAALRAGLPLSVALEVSYGDERVFQSALIQAKEALQKARATLSTGFDGSKESLIMGRDVAQLASDLHDEMERKAKKPGSRSRAQ